MKKGDLVQVLGESGVSAIVLHINYYKNGQCEVFCAWFDDNIIECIAKSDLEVISESR